MSLPQFPEAQSSACTACFEPISCYETTTPDQIKISREILDSGLIGMCQLCLHVMVLEDDGRFRDLTKTEAARFPSHPYFPIWAENRRNLRIFYG